MIAIASALQNAEPAPTGWAATGEALLRHAETRPDAFWPVVAVALPLLLVAGIALVIVRWILPAWKAEKLADREALVTSLRDRGAQAEKDAEKDREVAKAQNEAIVQRIESKVERVTGELARIDGRIEKHGEILSPQRELGARMDRLSAELAPLRQELAQLSASVQRIASKLGLLLLLLVALYLAVLLDAAPTAREPRAHATTKSETPSPLPRTARWR